MKIKNIRINMVVLVVMMVALGACKKDENDVEEPQFHHHEEELITTVTVHFSEKGNSSNHVMGSFRDLDGEGGNDPTIDTLNLDTNTTYEVSIELLNESEDPAEDITSEVREEDGEHIFCYESSTSNVSVNITDSDGTHPIGLESEWLTGDASSGTVKVTLKHQPDGAKDGTCTPGETDIEVSFPVLIQ